MACSCVVMRAILHDWMDEPAAAILRGLRARLRAGDKLIVLEPLPSEYGTPGLDSTLHAVADITMLAFQGKVRVSVMGGRARVCSPVTRCLCRSAQSTR